MFVYTSIHGEANINQQVYLILFFLSHYTVVYFNAALNPAILILRSQELTSFTQFHLFELLHRASCGLVKEKQARTRRESMSVNARFSCSVLDNSTAGRKMSCAVGRFAGRRYTRTMSQLSHSAGSPTNLGSPEGKKQSSADLLKSCSTNSASP